MVKARAYIDADGIRLYPPRLLAHAYVTDEDDNVLLDESIVCHGDGTPTDFHADGIRGVSEEAREALADDTGDLLVFDPESPYHMMPVDWEHGDYFPAPRRTFNLSQIARWLEQHNVLSVAGSVFYTVCGIVEDCNDIAWYRTDFIGRSVELVEGGVRQGYGYFMSKELFDAEPTLEPCDFPDARLTELIEAGIIDPAR